MGKFKKKLPTTEIVITCNCTQRAILVSAPFRYNPCGKNNSRSFAIANFRRSKINKLKYYILILIMRT